MPASLTMASPFVARLTAIALGSNQGDRRSHLAFAVSQLRPILSTVRVSSFLDTAPVGVPEQPDFLNGVVVGACDIEPLGLFDRLMAIEREHGRARPFRGAPRTLDLDLIMMGDLVMRHQRLELPHPRFRERRFVLEPLVEVAPDFVDPVTGRTVADLLADLDRSSL